MTTGVDIQYFSHLNGLILSNNWGDMVRLLDTCLVNGLPLTSITSAEINNQGDIVLNLYADHKSMLFQIIELSGFLPNELNGRYRIKGAPSSSQLILKAAHAGKTITTTGTAKLASLNYEIIFRDANDVKRVYRAKNPRTEHPFIRVDETISDGVNAYSSTYAKSAMVGLIENMAHIDDYLDANKLQLPLDISDFSRNWKISGSGSTVTRGWCKWHWAGGGTESTVPDAGNRQFTITGSRDAFFLNLPVSAAISSINKPYLMGCGLYEKALLNDLVPNWFLMSHGSGVPANATFLNYIRIQNSQANSSPLCSNQVVGGFYTPKYNLANRMTNSALAYGIMPDYRSGSSSIYSSNQISALQIPLYDADKYLRGTLPHVCYSGNSLNNINQTTPMQGGKSMYVADRLLVETGSYSGGVYFYLGELP